MRSPTQDSSVESLYWLDKLQPTQSAVMGQTALDLHRLVKAKCPVVPGVFLGTTALQEFCRSITWSSPFLSDFPRLSLRLQPEQPFQLQAVADEICQQFQATPLPPLWLAQKMAELQPLSSDCLRLSPSLIVPPEQAEYVPQLMGMLPVHYCQFTPTSVEKTIKQVWSSLFKAQTLFLLQKFAIPIDHLQLGIVLQPIEGVQASGFLAVTQTHIQIQATYGLSESIYTGDVLPDIYLFDRKTEHWQKYPGQITCSYQPATQPLASILPSTDALVTHVLSPAPQQPFVLDTLRLEQLLTLTQDLPHLEGLSVVEWVSVATDSESKSGFKVIGVCPETPFPIPKAANVDTNEGLITADSEPLLITSGLAAAIGQVTAPILVLKDRHRVQPQDVIGHIIVLEEVVPADLGWLQQVSGLICTTGGYTSHGAIMARELGVPAIVGATSALTCLQAGQWVMLDGIQGKVYEPAQLRKPTDPLVSDRPPTAILKPLKTQVWVNLSQSQSLQRALQVPAQGVGLLRAEWFLLDICQGRPPADWVQHHGPAEFVDHLSQHLYAFVQGWQPRPVFYRSLDLKSDALAGVHGSQPSAIQHSVLGLRGASHYMYDPTLFDLELQALARLWSQGYQNLRLILPFVRSVEEFQFCRDRLQAADLLDQIPLWMMAEVPSVLFQLPEYVAAGLQGIAIGTNDLTQLLLGVDREHTYLAQKYAADHPAMRAAMAQLIKMARELGIPCSICGQAPIQNPELIQEFVEWGVTAISVDMAAVVVTRDAIAIAEQQLQAESNLTFDPTAIQND